MQDGFRAGPYNTGVVLALHRPRLRALLTMWYARALVTTTVTPEQDALCFFADGRAEAAVTRAVTQQIAVVPESLLWHQHTINDTPTHSCAGLSHAARRHGAGGPLALHYTGLFSREHKITCMRKDDNWRPV